MEGRGNGGGGGERAVDLDDDQFGPIFEFLITLFGASLVRSFTCSEVFHPVLTEKVQAGA